MNLGWKIFVILISLLIQPGCSIFASDLSMNITIGDAVASNDEEMIQAAAEAQATLDQFITYLQEASPQYQLSLKAKFPILGSDMHYEHLWLNNVTYDGEVFLGVVDSMPLYLQTISYLDLVQVNKSYVTDWMMVEDGYVTGGYTIRVQRSRMSEEEREKFDDENGFIIND